MRLLFMLPIIALLSIYGIALILELFRGHEFWALQHGFIIFGIMMSSTYVLVKTTKNKDKQDVSFINMIVAILAMSVLTYIPAILSGLIGLMGASDLISVLIGTVIFVIILFALRNTAEKHKGEINE